jgi:hypothetical protein
MFLLLGSLLIFLEINYSAYTTSRCQAYKVSISHTESLQSIEFYKDGNKLPDFLLNFDFSDYLDNDFRGGSGHKLRADTHDAFFDTIVIKKKLDSNGGENQTGVIEVHDEVTGEVWTGTFGTLGGGSVETFSLDDFIIAPPWNRVQVIDTMQ